MIRNLIFISLVVGLSIMYYYNITIKSRNKKRDAWSSINVQLKRRYDLIPNLVQTVKGYASHESKVFEHIADARARAIGADNIEDQQAAENMLTQSLKSLFAVAEAYPELKASHNFQNLQQQLSKVEEDIQMARRYYNACAREYNNRVETFPGLIVAGMFNFSPVSYFEIDIEESQTPKVDFS